MKKITLKQAIEQNKDLVGDKDAFFGLLTKASQPVYPSNDEKAASQTSGDYNDKQTRQHKVEGAED